MINEIDVEPWPIEDNDKPDNMSQEFRIHGKCHVTGKKQLMAWWTNDVWLSG